MAAWAAYATLVSTFWDEGYINEVMSRLWSAEDAPIPLEHT